MSRTSPISKPEVRERAATARQHLMLAEVSLPDAVHYEPSLESQAAASNAILAGIAAADAICGHATGERATGQDHRDAVALLASVQPEGVALSKKLARLLGDKSQLRYGRYCTRAKALEMIGLAADLIAALDDRIPPTRGT